MPALAFSKEKFSHPGRAHLDHDGRKWAEHTLRKMSLEEKVGQVFMIWVRAQFMNVDNPDYLQLRDTIRKYHIGSLAMTVRFEPPFLYRNEPLEAAELLNRLQRDSPYPLLIAADFERGVSMRLNGATVFPHAMAFGAAGKIEYAKQFGRITAEESRAIGVHWNFFPDADVNSNPANPIINTRSFGEDPGQVGSLVSAYIQGAREQGMLTTVKHFPGHGDTTTDSHLGVAQVTGDLTRLQAVELPPFKQAIDAGVDAVMLAHVTVPALDPAPNRVATTSPAIASDLLKKQLGFRGIVVTDALDMAGLTRMYTTDIGRAAVDSFKAGSDMLILPADLDASYQAMLQAVRSGEISREQLDASVHKILEAKASLGLHKARLVDVSEVSSLVGKPENLAQGQQVSDAALTLVRDNGKILPIKHEGTVKAALPYQGTEEIISRVIAVIFSEDVRMDAGRVLEREIRVRAPGAHIIYVDARIAGPMAAQVMAEVDAAEKVVAAIYDVPVAGRAIKSGNTLANTVSLPEASAALLQAILRRAAEKTIVVAMGNPYLLQDFPSAQVYLCAFSNASVSEVSAAKALFGEIPIAGHLPVTIPGVAPRGFGIDRPKQVVNGGFSHAQNKSFAH
ncbi:MAG TPA: glycoside hydrolase family 3 N-terminal domain-containing protein [Terriglobales bacterium]|nr:glycoside hydrolase family 3 N-terminal domain-containing protein [Terriglobales bacterium]